MNKETIQAYQILEENWKNIFKLLTDLAKKQNLKELNI
jgi:hypothetical protein